MSGTGSRVRGRQALRRRLRALPAVVRGEIAGAVAEAAAEVYRRALADMPKPGSHPYATGALRRRFRLFMAKDGLTARIGSWGLRRARHIHLVEFGAAPHDIPMPDGRVLHHPGAPAQPFLLPAWAAVRGPFRRDLGRAISRALRRASRAAADGGE